MASAEYDSVAPMTPSDLLALAVEPSASRTPLDDAPLEPSPKEAVSWDYVVMTDIGGRDEQQDVGRVMEMRSSDDPRATVLVAAVCDGHGTGSPSGMPPRAPNGRTAATEAIDAIFSLPKEAAARFGFRLDPTPSGLSRFMRHAAEAAHFRMQSLTWSVSDPIGADCGTTMCAAAVARVSPSGTATAVISNIGDSQAMLVSRYGKVKLFTAPHKPQTDPSPDLRRDACSVKELPPSGGQYLTAPGVAALAMSRAIGHTLISAVCGVVPRPTVYVERIEDGDVLLVASDGVWDHYGPAREQLAADLARDISSTAQSIIPTVKQALQGGADNMTLALVRFNVSRIQAI